MTMVFKDELFDSQWLRAASHCSSGGADIAECFAAARQIGEPDAERWFAAWSQLADAVFASAENSAALNHHVSARAAFLRASN